MSPEATKSQDSPPIVLRNVLVPKALLRKPERFGGITEQDCLRGDLTIHQGHAQRLTPAPAGPAPRMMMPALVEAHCHLDKCHTIGRMARVGGDLSAALEAQRRDKANWTATDLRQRMAKGLSEFEQSGCGAVRSHIDWGDAATPPLAWSVLGDLAPDHPGLVLQSAALIGIAQLADPQFCADAAKAVSARDGGVMGAFILDHEKEDIKEGLANAFAAAERYGFALDFHVDEGLGAFNGLETICDTAIETGFQGPILCGHAVSLMDRQGSAFTRLIDKLLRTNVTICALPTTNLYLQGRTSGTPDRRGITRLKELHGAGVPIAVGSDNVADAFCPMGQHDPRAALHLAALAAHLDPPMGEWLPAITLNSACAMGLAAPFIEDTPLNDLRLCRAANTSDLTSVRLPLLPLSQHPEVQPA
ncbi:MAG: amidohydrolase family protein [Pseudomonadota bacterium]